MVDDVGTGVVGSLRDVREHLRVLTRRRTGHSQAYGFVLYLRDAGVLVPRGPDRWELPRGGLAFVRDLDLTGTFHEVAARLPDRVRYLHRYYAAVFLRRVRREGPWYDWR